MAIIREKPTSRPFTVGLQTGDRTLSFWVAGTADEGEVEVLIQSMIPQVYRGLFFQQYSAEPDEDGLGWHVEAKYGVREQKQPGQFSVSFDTTGGTTKITQSKENVANYIE